MLQESLPQGQYIISPPGMNPAENPYDPSYNVRLQQLIVPAEDAQTYEKFIREKYPNLKIDMQRVSPEQAKANVDGGVALEIKTPLSQITGNQQQSQTQVPPVVAQQTSQIIAESTNTTPLSQVAYNYKPNDPAVMKATMEQYNKDVAAGTVKDFSVPASQQNKGSEDKDGVDGIIKTVEHTGTIKDLAYNKTGSSLGSLLPEIKINKEDVPGVIANVANMIAKASSKEENKMENTNNTQAQVPAQTQAAAPATTENKTAEAANDNISWKKVAKCTGLVLGGVGIGAAVFGGRNSSEPAPAEALKSAMSAADTMAKADPKAIGSAVKSLVNGFFSI